MSHLSLAANYITAKLTNLPITSLEDWPIIHEPGLKNNLTDKQLFTWLWWWPLQRLLKCQSLPLSTVLLRTSLTTWTNYMLIRLKNRWKRVAGLLSCFNRVYNRKTLYSRTVNSRFKPKTVLKTVAVKSVGQLFQ